MSNTNPATARSTASRSSFYWAMRLLPHEKREAMYAIYAFCRAVDDIADNIASSDADLKTQLELWRAAIASLYRGRPSGRAAFLEAHVHQFALREADFLSLIDGMEMDASGAMVAPHLQDLDRYCDCVASAVGRLSIKVFGMEDTSGFWLAHHLGRALQLTNILRDLDEDAGLGRLYLPRELLESASVPHDSPARAIAHPAIDTVCRGVAELAEMHYRETDTIFRSRPRGDLRPSRLMAAVYSAMLDRMKKCGWLPPRQRAQISKPALIGFILRYGVAI